MASIGKLLFLFVMLLAAVVSWSLDIDDHNLEEGYAAVRKTRSSGKNGDLDRLHRPRKIWQYRMEDRHGVKKKKKSKKKKPIEEEIQASGDEEREWTKGSPKIRKNKYVGGRGAMSKRKLANLLNKRSMVRGPSLLASSSESSSSTSEEVSHKAHRKHKGFLRPR